MDSSTRRRFLRSGSVGAVAVLAGCSALGTSTHDTDQRLGALGVFNDAADTLRVSTLIARNGEKLYWRTHDLATDDSLHVEPPDYDPGRGQYTIAVRIEDGPSEVHEVSETANPVAGDCHFVLVKLTGDHIAFGRGTAEEYTTCEESG